jgi:UDP-3-O-[3-hydroxymyristoyl] glucosamine N-acyltransferase
MNATLSELASLVQGEVTGNPLKQISGVAPFDRASGEDVTLAGSARFLKRLDECGAGALIVPRDTRPCERNLLRVENPQVAFAKVVSFFFPSKKPSAGIHPAALIGAQFSSGVDVAIAAGVVIGDRVAIGHRVWLFPGVYLGDDVQLGDDVILYPNVTILDGCRLGRRVTVHAGTVIGSDGFGFAPDGHAYHKIPHIGTVEIEDDVEIGANNTIDRATFGKTQIGRGVKTDNLVHIAHNVSIGEDTVIVSQVGISGSVTVGRHVILAGQAGIAGHLTIGDGATIGPRAGVAKSVAPGQVVMGAPEMPHKQWLRVQRIIPMLPDLKKRLEDLEKKLQKLQKEAADS